MIFGERVFLFFLSPIGIGVGTNCYLLSILYFFNFGFYCSFMPFRF